MTQTAARNSGSERNGCDVKPMRCGDFEANASRGESERGSFTLFGVSSSGRGHRLTTIVLLKGTKEPMLYNHIGMSELPCMPTAQTYVVL